MSNKTEQKKTWENVYCHDVKTIYDEYRRRELRRKRPEWGQMMEDEKQCGEKCHTHTHIHRQNTDTSTQDENTTITNQQYFRMSHGTELNQNPETRNHSPQIEFFLPVMNTMV